MSIDKFAAVRTTHPSRWGRSRILGQSAYARANASDAMSSASAALAAAARLKRRTLGRIWSNQAEKSASRFVHDSPLGSGCGDRLRAMLSLVCRREGVHIDETNETTSSGDIPASIPLRATQAAADRAFDRQVTDWVPRPAAIGASAAALDAAAQLG
jgi:hypothetical protein